MEISEEILFAISISNTHAAKLQLALSHALPSFPCRLKLPRCKLYDPIYAVAKKEGVELL